MCLAIVLMVTEGIDAPSSECVLVLRPTMSVALWLQMSGLGARLAPCKSSLHVLDATDNALRLRDPLWHRQWTAKALSDIFLPVLLYHIASA